MLHPQLTVTLHCWCTADTTDTVNNILAKNPELIFVLGD
jgi:hypothetical protein